MTHRQNCSPGTVASQTSRPNTATVKIDLQISGIKKLDILGSAQTAAHCLK